ncbi:type II toxin-antitoxin system RelE/ParE family toxin [Aromatoleum anaerobium]|uniref:Type II toxin-antitoxin system RelE/ParE family toxin n=1 Tax=Aromatoleum anaerobium TaxID=182180 RepID=A0ABX1PUD8_9RHOO|nr:type II toxin-antitoxin system RelE/ParE family toxin [Aromatoleum anaerobium]MCK0506885.1 type II toxin-antitoxin system RelE/ParE family toxin [Aromatoleum anaerobium]
MTPTQRASVAATPHFAACLEEAKAFFVEQDETTADERFRVLRAELREMTETLGWAPAGGRPARFFAGRSVQARIRARKVQALADEAGLPHLREYVLKNHVVLYANSSDRVVLLAIRHQRQLSYVI